jgi:hypothetical protein
MEISITRALTELKTLDKRIQKAINSTQLISIQGKFKQPDERTKKASADYQSILALLKRRQEIKSKIVMSNALTKVTIDGKDMTVAEAIEMKSSIKHYKTLLGTMKAQYGESVKTMELINNQVRHELENKSNRGENKTETGNTMSLSDFSKTYMDMHGVKLYDPIGLSNKVEDIDKLITGFENEVDFVLSEKNAVTKITVSE